MNAFLEALSDMSVTYDKPTMDAILEGTFAMMEASDLGYTGSLRTYAPGGAVERYLQRHPECSGPKEAARILAKRRESINAIIARNQASRPAPQVNHNIAMEKADAGMVGKFVSLPRSYGSIGKVVEEKRTSDGLNYVVDAVTRRGEKYRDTVPAYGTMETRDPRMISVWNSAYGIAAATAPAPVQPVAPAPVPGPAKWFRIGDRVEINYGRFNGMFGTYEGVDTGTQKAIVSVSCMGKSEEDIVPFGRLRNEQAAQREAAATAQPGSGKRTVRVVYTPRPR